MIRKKRELIIKIAIVVGVLDAIIATYVHSTIVQSITTIIAVITVIVLLAIMFPIIGYNDDDTPKEISKDTIKIVNQTKDMWKAEALQLGKHVITLRKELQWFLNAHGHTASEKCEYCDRARNAIKESEKIGWNEV